MAGRDWHHRSRQGADAQFPAPRRKAHARRWRARRRARSHRRLGEWQEGKDLSEIRQQARRGLSALHAERSHRQYRLLTTVSHEAISPIVLTKLPHFIL